MQAIVTAWRANASYVRGVLDSAGLAAAQGPLLGQFVQVSRPANGSQRYCVEGGREEGERVGERGNGEEEEV